MSGFTLLELLVVLAVMAIFSTIAAPALTPFIAAQQVRSASADLHASLQAARSEALTRNVLITLRPADGDWARGWTITDAEGSVLRRQSSYTQVVFVGPGTVTFNGDGRVTAATTAFAVSTRKPDTSADRCVRLRLNGRAAIERGAC